MLLFLIAGCTADLTAREAEEIIFNYYEKKGYNVTELNIRQISPIPMKEKTYMGTPSFVVDISSIRLEISRERQEAQGLEPARPIAFTNARMMIQQSRSEGKEWTIAYISGINIH